MTRRSFVSACLLGLVVLAGPAQADPSAAMRGRIAFMRCAACHSLGAGEPHKIGPNLRGVIGADAAQAAGYSYTPALRQSGLRWDDASLKQWIRDPAAMVPGNSMAYSNTLTEPDIEALLTYLKAETAVR